MPKQKKPKPEKYYLGEEIEAELKKIVAAYPDKFSHISLTNFTFLFKTGKNKLGKKHVSIKLIKEPYTILTGKKAMFIVTNEWYKEEIDSDRTKAFIEALVSITLDEDGTIIRRDYDVKTFSEFVKDGALDYSKFSKLLPAEARKEDLVLSA
jgi:hypothetical protein